MKVSALAAWPASGDPLMPPPSSPARRTLKAGVGLWGQDSLQGCVTLGDGKFSLCPTDSLSAGRLGQGLYYHHAGGCLFLPQPWLSPAVACQPRAVGGQQGAGEGCAVTSIYPSLAPWGGGKLVLQSSRGHHHLLHGNVSWVVPRNGDWAPKPGSPGPPASCPCWERCGSWH